jgi:phosphatidate cytidylyltransferase
MATLVMHRPWWVGAILAVVVVIFGTAGDLIESLIKRDIGIKDMSSFLPGHGGVMDRLDSTLVAVPAAWLLFTLLEVGA